MPDAAKTGMIFLVLGFFVYLAYKNELGTYGKFATTGSISAASPTTTTSTTTAVAEGVAKAVL